MKTIIILIIIALVVFFFFLFIIVKGLSVINDNLEYVLRSLYYLIKDIEKVYKHVPSFLIKSMEIIKVW